MESKRNIFHEFQFLEASRNRKKVDIDGYRLIEASKEDEKTDGFESRYDLRKSLAWDSAFFTSPGVLDPEELFDTLNINGGDNGLKDSSAESMAASRIGECMARRSLAWDAAFFNSAGVLNPEELCLVNNGYKKSETVTHKLPGIEQEFWKSTESNSTMDSDYSLSSLEIDLFDDMRASMQKSSKASNVVNSSCKLQSRTSTPNPRFSKRPDTTSSQRVKTLPASRRPKTTADGVGKLAKEAVNPSNSQHGTRTGELDSSSSLKLSKANPFSPGATTRASVGANQMKVNNKIRKAVSGQNMSKKPCIGDRSTPSPEPTPSRLHIGSKDLSGSICGHNASIVKSPISLRRKNDSAASDLGARTPSKSLTLHKSKLIDSSHPTGLQSTPKSSSTPLSTSVECSSSESSASLNHANNDASPGSYIANSFNDQLVPSGSKETRFPHQDVVRSSKGSCHLTSSVSRETKPSGLRLPSPKIGFFEVGNSRELTPNGGLKFHSGLQSSCKTRTGANHINGIPSRASFSKLQSPRTSTRTANSKERKPGSLKTGTRGSSSDIKSKCAENYVSCESSNGHGSKKNGFGSYGKGDDKSTTQPESKGNVTQIVDKSSQEQNEAIIAHNRDGKENLFSLKNQVDVLTKQIEAIDVNGDSVIEL